MILVNNEPDAVYGGVKQAADMKWTVCCFVLGLVHPLPWSTVGKGLLVLHKLKLFVAVFRKAKKKKLVCVFWQLTAAVVVVWGAAWRARSVLQLPSLGVCKRIQVFQGKWQFAASYFTLGNNFQQKISRSKFLSTLLFCIFYLWRNKAVQTPIELKPE